MMSILSRSSYSRSIHSHILWSSLYLWWKERECK